MGLIAVVATNLLYSNTPCHLHYLSVSCGKNNISSVLTVKNTLFNENK